MFYSTSKGDVISSKYYCDNLIFVVAVSILFREGTGRVHSVDFIREFFYMGKQEKIKMSLAHKEEMQKIQEKKLKRIEVR